MTSAKRKQVALALRDKAYRDALVEAEINTTLPFQIRSIRMARGWSQVQLGQRTGQAQKTISDFENPAYGRLTLTSLKRLASALDVALVVRLVPFGEFVDWASTASGGRTNIPWYDVDTGLREIVSADENGADSAQNSIVMVCSGTLGTQSTVASENLGLGTIASAPVTGQIHARREIAA